jgi:hypothetical protein
VSPDALKHDKKRKAVGGTTVTMQPRLRVRRPRGEGQCESEIGKRKEKKSKREKAKRRKAQFLPAVLELCEWLFQRKRRIYQNGAAIIYRHPISDVSAKTLHRAPISEIQSPEFVSFET